VLTHTGRHANAPAWSPDRKTIAYAWGVGPIELSKGATPAPAEDGIYLIDVASSKQTRLTKSGDFPAWSPDGTRIAFTNNARGATIATVKADGSALHALTASHALDLGPAWSPDGTRIAFTRYGDTTKALWVMAADGSGARQLRSAPLDDPNVGMGYTPSWAPTGTQLAWVETTHHPNYVLGLAVVSADGSKAVSLTPKGTPEGILDAQPAWSPDGTTIAMASLRDGKTLRLYLVHPDGSGAKPVSSDANQVAAGPAWGP
jgi:TolB protein